VSGFLLDTNIVSQMIRSNAAVDHRVRAAKQAGIDLVLSPMVEYEGRRGLLKRGAVRSTELFEAIRPAFVYRPFDEATWLTGADLWPRHAWWALPLLMLIC
jgi:predicted nucleic acid-binding protein